MRAPQLSTMVSTTTHEGLAVWYATLSATPSESLSTRLVTPSPPPPPT
jgi:hypothetical protein